MRYQEVFSFVRSIEYILFAKTLKLAYPSKTVYFGGMSNKIILKKNEEHRIAAGHQWVFSNEIASLRGTPEVGEVVELLRHDEKFLGLGFYHPHSLIAFRFLTSELEDINFSFFEQRFQQALKLRQRLYPGAETFRLAHGESDFLPGLIIDKYNEYICMQVFSAGMEKQTDILCDVLESMFHPKAIIARNDMTLRTLEELPLEKKVLRGNAGITIINDSVKFEIDVLNGQKTGFYLDQRENRKAIHRYALGGTVLDCYCNEGGFALHAVSAKATSVQGFDISESAIVKAQVNARLNSALVEFKIGDASKILKFLEEKKKKFDMVILDPPSFTKNKKNIPSALRGYKDINAAALRLINAGGFLATASCSHHITEDGFLSAIEQAAVKTKRKVQLLQFAGAAPDHPVIPAMPETKYLKFAIFAVQ